MQLKDKLILITEGHSIETINSGSVRPLSNIFESDVYDTLFIEALVDDVEFLFESVLYGQPDPSTSMIKRIIEWLKQKFTQFYKWMQEMDKKIQMKYNEKLASAALKKYLNSKSNKRVAIKIYETTFKKVPFSDYITKTTDILFNNLYNTYVKTGELPKEFPVEYLDANSSEYFKKQFADIILEKVTGYSNISLDSIHKFLLGDSYMYNFTKQNAQEFGQIVGFYFNQGDTWYDFNSTQSKRLNEFEAKLNEAEKNSSADDLKKLKNEIHIFKQLVIVYNMISTKLVQCRIVMMDGIMRVINEINKYV